jgi:phage terminase large subunit-like protein
MGLDLSSTTDLSALALVFPPEDKDHGNYEVVMRHWSPEKRLEERSRRDRVPYRHWAEQGALSTTDGNVIDYEAIEREIQRLTLIYRVPQLAIDRLFNAEYMAQRVSNFGLTVERHGQNYLDMNFPTQELLRLILQRRITHGGAPILRWQIDNLMVETDAAGNVKPSKSKSTQRIDGAVALIMALGLALRHVQRPNLLETVARPGVQGQP